jgi:hypothetical protein
MGTRSQFDPNFFTAKITDDADAPLYSWVEVWDVNGDGSAPEEKVGGRYGDSALNPGVDVLGYGFAVDDVVIVRMCQGTGGLSWELYPIPASPGLTGTGTDNHVVRWDTSTTPTSLQDSAVTIDDGGSLYADGLLQSREDGTLYAPKATLDYAAWSGGPPALGGLSVATYSDSLGTLGSSGWWYYVPYFETSEIASHAYNYWRARTSASKETWVTAHGFGVFQGFGGGETYSPGVSGTLGPGATTINGIVTDPGSGSFFGGDGGTW